MKKTIITICVAFVLIFMIGFVSAKCVVPTDGMIITEDTTFCDGEYYLPNGVIIKGNNVVLDCGNAKLIGNGTVSYYNSGIEVSSYSSYNTIRRCNVSNYTNGFSINGYSNTFVENIASNSSRYGFRTFGSNTYFNNNKAFNNYNSGFFIFSSENNILINNLAMHNGESHSSSSSGIDFQYTTNNIAINNSLINNHGGIGAQRSNNITIIGNIIKNNSKNGLEWYVGSDILIEDNIFTNGGGNIFFMGDGNSTNVKIRDNLLIGSYRSIMLWSVNNMEIYGNTIREAERYSIYIVNENFHITSNNSIWDNDIYDTDIFDENSSNNIYCVDCVGNNYFNGATGPTCPLCCFDEDNDGVPNDEDKCPNTEGEQIIYGCSCKQILELKHGENKKSVCNPGIIKVFTEGIGWAKDLF